MKYKVDNVQGGQCVIDLVVQKELHKDSGSF
jgi:hypothetical protein